MNDSQKKFAGLGVGYRPQYREQLFAGSCEVNWVEIISENFMNCGGIQSESLKRILSMYPVAMHGVGLSIAGNTPFDQEYLRHLETLHNNVNPIVFSDHLCWTSHLGAHSHDLLPLPYTQQTLKHVISRVQFIQDKFQRQLTLENPTTYIQFANNELTEGEFFRELVNATGCGVLLDLNNIYVNAMNLGTSQTELIDNLPEQCVNQFHLAGHSVTDKAIIDTHSSHVIAEVLDLWHVARKKFPVAPTLLEWDEDIPEFALIEAELVRIKNWQHKEKPSQNKACERSSYTASSQVSATWKDLEQGLFSYITTNTLAVKPHLSNSLPTRANDGMSVYQKGYFLRIRDVLQDTFPLLYYILEQDSFDFAVRKFLRKSCLKSWSLDRIGRDFVHFLAMEPEFDGVDCEGDLLVELASFDLYLSECFLANDAPFLEPEFFQSLSPETWESLKLDFVPGFRMRTFDWDLKQIYNDYLDHNEEPDIPEESTSWWCFYRDESLRPQPEEIGELEFFILDRYHAGLTFGEIAEALESKSVADSMQFHLQTLAKWAGRGMLQLSDKTNTRPTLESQSDLGQDTPTNNLSY